MNNNDRFCAKCGTPRPLAPTVGKNNGNDQGENNQYMDVDSRAKRKKAGKLKVFLLAFAVIFAIATAFVAGMFFMHKKNEFRQKAESAEVEINKLAEEKITEVMEDVREKEVEETSLEEELPEIVMPEELSQEEELQEFLVYTDYTYGFYCAYPAEFASQEPTGINAVRSFVSPDETAKITIRANSNSVGLTAEEALEEFCASYGESITYKASGNTWYAASVTKNGRSLYRKFFATPDCIYCMDFEMNEADVDKYSSYIEYIEDNFGAAREN